MPRCLGALKNLNSYGSSKLFSRKKIGIEVNQVVEFLIARNLCRVEAEKAPLRNKWRFIKSAKSPPPLKNISHLQKQFFSLRLLEWKLKASEI